MKVAILGTVPASKMLAPFKDESWEIWVCSAGNRGGVIPRVTRWFELHAIGDLEGEENKGWLPEYCAWLNAQPFKLYTLEPSELFPQAATFPGLDLLAKFGPRARVNISSSPAWMILYAMDLGAEEIGIFGVDMAAPEEHYTNQKAGLLNLIVWAQERGIKVTVPHESCLGTNPPVYGYAEATRVGRRLVVRELEVRKAVADLDATIARLTGERHMFAGALDQIQYFRRTFVDGEDAELDLPPAKAENVPVRTLASGVILPSAAVDLSPLTNGGDVQHHPIALPGKKRGEART